MNKPADLKIDNRWIRGLRGPRNRVDPAGPCLSLVERERSLSGEVEEVITLFLTGKECSFTCLMCDLWKNSTEDHLPAGTIPGQIRQALSALPQAPQIKLYNSASFFDPACIPPDDLPAIAELVSPFNTVIVENHPLLTGDHCLEFNRMIGSGLQVAMGLETVHPRVLGYLNKKMTPGDFRSAVSFLSRHGISTRAFILLKPPFLSEREGILWAKRSIDYALDCGTDCITVIPVREGNGAMEQLRQMGCFSPPRLQSLEEVLEYGIGLGAGTVFADTWDLHRFSGCGTCLDERKIRIEQMNLSQQILPAVECRCEKTASRSFSG